MKYFSQSPSITFSFLLGALIFGSRLVLGFTEPTSTPPLENAPAPLTTGSTGQSKAGGLILNTGGATNGLIVDKGSVGIGTQSPSQKLDVIGYIRAASGICIGSDCRTSWPSSTSYSAGTGISISGTTISSGITGGTCTVGQVVTALSSTGVPTCSGAAKSQVSSTGVRFYPSWSDTSWHDVLTTSVTTRGGAVLVVARTSLFNPVPGMIDGSNTNMRIARDGVALGYVQGPFPGAYSDNPTAITVNFPYLDTPSAGTHTYSLQIALSGAGPGQQPSAQCDNNILLVAEYH